MNNSHSAPGRIRTRTFNALVIRYTDNIIHQRHRIFEYRVVDSLKNVVSILYENYTSDDLPIVVCSAVSGVTDHLLRIGKMAEQGKSDVIFQEFENLRVKHIMLAEHFGVEQVFIEQTKDLFIEYKNFVKGLALIGEFSAQSKASLSSLGERLSSRLLVEILKSQNLPAKQFDSFFIKTIRGEYLEADINWHETKIQIKKTIGLLLKKNIIPVVTGFFGMDDYQTIALLGRGGSDFSATILSLSLNIKNVEIWTDVDGFLSADPKLVKNARVIDEIGFSEVSELCFFGAKVLHPKTIRPVIENGGMVWIKNTFAPKKKGTRITKHGPPSSYPVLSITKKKVVHLSLDMFGVSMNKHKSDIFYELFSVIKKYRVCIDAIATSESMISFCLEEKFIKNSDFLQEINVVAPLEIRKDRVILCIVSPENVKGTSGILGKIFSALGEAGISIEMDSENATELTQLVVVKSDVAEQAVKVIHEKLIENRVL
jgi:aspartate kinase